MSETDYDSNDKWGHHFKKLADYEFEDGVEAEDVEWIASAEAGLREGKFVGFEDGPISFEAEDHQKAAMVYVTDVIETADSLLVELDGVSKDLNFKKSAEYRGEHE